MYVYHTSIVNDHYSLNNWTGFKLIQQTLENLILISQTVQNSDVIGDP